MEFAIKRFCGKAKTVGGKNRWRGGAALPTRFYRITNIRAGPNRTGLDRTGRARADRAIELASCALHGSRSNLFDERAGLYDAFTGLVGGVDQFQYIIVEVSPFPSEASPLETFSSNGLEWGWKADRSGRERVEAGWNRAGSGLEACWKRVGSGLEACGIWAGVWLEAGGKRAGSGLEAGSKRARSGLEAGLQRA